MTTYIDGKAVGVGTIRAEIGVTGNVLHDDTLVGNGNTDPLGVNTANIVSQQTLANTISVLNTAIDAQAEAIAKTRENSVKKSGDTMTGDLVFDMGAGGLSIGFNGSFEIVNTGQIVPVQKHIDANSQINGLTFYEVRNNAPVMQYGMTEHGFYCLRGDKFLGTSNYPWEKIYAKKLNNGADITIPTLGGTLARIEDLQNATTTLNARIADKQDKLTAGTGIKIDGNVISATGGGASLPDQTGNYGKFLITDGNTASWSDTLSNLTILATNTFGSPMFSLSAGGQYDWTFYIQQTGLELHYGGYKNNVLKFPTTGGTLALKEDIDAVVGDISTALTAILGE